METRSRLIARFAACTFAAISVSATSAPRDNTWESIERVRGGVERFKPTAQIARQSKTAGQGTTQSTGDSDISAIWIAVQTISENLAQNGGTALSAVEQQQLADALATSNFDSSKPDVSAALTQIMLSGLPRLDIAELAPQVTHHLLGFYLNRNGDSGMALGMLLYPYMDEAGLCNSTGESANGVLCQFTFGTRGATMGAVTDEGLVPTVDPESALGQILTAATSSSGSPVVAKGWYHDDETGFEQGSIQYNYLGVLPVKGDYAAYYAWHYDCDTDITCDGKVAGYGAIRGLYAAVGADTVFAAAGASKHCSTKETFEGLANLAGGKDIIAHVLNKCSTRYRDIHAPAKAVHALVPACGTVPGSYAASPMHYVLNNTDFPLPYDIGVELKFGTYFQKPNVSGTAATYFPNLDPGPPTRTHYKLLNDRPSSNVQGYVLGQYASTAAILGYEYEFSKLQAWSFDIIFAATNSATGTALDPIPDQCRTNLSASAFNMGDGKAYGDQFWFYQGTKSGSDDALPSISLGIGF